jgi:arylsulfatase A-like enzyme
MPVRKTSRRRFVATGAMAAAAWGLPRRARAAAAPNLVVIVVDDMRFDEYGAGGHPYLQTPHIDSLKRSGATFTNAYHTTPLCSPNRACILTGQYTSRHGILDNTSRAHASHRLQTFARELQRGGYETAHIGKWHMGNDPTPRPGYDHWVSFEGQGRSIDPILYEQGRLQEVPGYLTDLLTDRAVDFVARTRSKPFLLFLGHKAVHPDARQRDDGSVDVAAGSRFVPAQRHMGRYAGKAFPRRPNFGMTAALRASQPVLAASLDIKQGPQMTKAFGPEVVGPTTDATIQARAEMMLAVDESVGRLVAALEQRALRENTLVVFMSDNGYFFGEHGLGVERRLPYEESVKSPLIVSHPASIAPGLSVGDFALSIDVAPTVLQAAGLAVPGRMQGRSLLPLLHGQKPRWRDSFLMEYYAHDNPFPWMVDLDYRAVRMGRHKYVRWIRKDDAEELYDLEVDPYEQRNLAGGATHAAVLAEARQVMASLVLETLGLPSPRGS